MQLIQLHPEFRLYQNSFKDISAFLQYIQKELSEDFSFLKNLLDTTSSIRVFTSGSTGKPKPVIIDKQKLLHSTIATGSYFELPPKTKALHCLSSQYIAGKMMWVRAIHLGWHLEVVAPTSTPLIGTNKTYDFAAMVPLQVQNSLKELYRIKKLIIGGAPVSWALEEKLAKIPSDIYQTYGMTETLTHIAVRKLSKKNTHACYKCLPEIKVSVDSRGCLVIYAPMFSDIPIITNDVVRLLTTDSFEWLGRSDTMINSGGVKLFPEQIEKKLASFFSVPFMIGGISDEKLGQKVVLIIESDKPIKDIKNRLEAAALTPYEMPKNIYYLSKFLRTFNGKIKRNDVIEYINK